MTAVLMAVQALATTSRELGVAKLNLEVISVRPAHLAVATDVPTLQVQCDPNTIGLPLMISHRAPGTMSPEYDWIALDD